MKNIKKNLLITLIILFSVITHLVLAEEITPIESTPNPETITIHLTIKTKDSSLYDQNINVNECDTDNHGTMKITAYCAILQSGIQNDWNWDWGPAFLNSLANIKGYTSKDKDDNDVYHYWSWSQNGTEGATSMSEYELKTNDTISLNFIDPMVPVSDPIPEPILESAPMAHQSSGGYVTPKIKSVFDLKKALDFLASQQKINGSFGEEIYTDWVALALAATPDYQDQKTKLIKYFSENKFSDTNLTDLERHAMTLMALNLNPYNINNENYIKKIINTFDGKQFGDLNEDNDDIFALIILQNAGYTDKDKIITDDVNFILSEQKDNGSWDNNVDMTGAGIEALNFLKNNIQIKNSLEKAENYLKLKQKEDGGWENVSSTAWAMEGILALGEKPENWIINGDSPLDYLAVNQDTDGGIKTPSIIIGASENINNKIWQTAYVVNVLSGKTWNQIMQKFSTPSLTSDGAKTLINKKEIIVQPAKKITKINKMKSNTLKQDTPQMEATSINAIETPPYIPPTTQKQNWFKKLLLKILGF